jgi:hypothetical protein
MHGKYYLTEKIKPIVNKMGNVQFTSDDVLFDWISFEIPRGTCAVKSVFATVAGTNGAAGNDRDMDLLFAQTVNGVAPPSLGDSNDAKNVIKTIAARPWIVGYYGINGSEMGDDGDGLVSYNVLGNGRQSATNHATNPPSLIIQGEPIADGGSATQGYQTIYIAGIAQGNFDFGTGCIVAGAHSADDLTIVIDGVDADDIFAIGDTLIAFDDDGSDETTIGKVTAVAADLITVDAAPNIIADDDEICNLNPMVFRLGLEY